jgi:SAM-dependent methyltransferase
MSAAVAELYGAALADPARGWRLRDERGNTRPLPVRRWLGETSDADDSLLDRVTSPVLDVGCGPGRLVVALHERGLIALGVDIAESAVRMARSRGAMVLHRSIFDTVPGHGRWACALLVDGNLGIGGDPTTLLRRLAELLAPQGHVYAEIEPPGVPTRMLRMRLEDDAGASGWFRWAEVGVDGVDGVTTGTGLRRVETWQDGERWFVSLRKG